MFGLSEEGGDCMDIKGVNLVRFGEVSKRCEEGRVGISDNVIVYDRGF